MLVHRGVVWMVGLSLLGSGCHDIDDVQRPCGDACPADAVADLPVDLRVDLAPPDVPGDRAAPETAPDKGIPVDLPTPDAPAPPKPIIGTCIKGGWCWMHPLPQGHTLRAVWAASATEAFAVGQHGTMLRWQAKKWQAVDCDTLAHLNGVWGSSPTNVWAVGDGGAVVRFDGTLCKPSKTMLHDLNGVWGHSATAVYAVGDKGSVYFAKSHMGFDKLTFTCGTKDLHAVWGEGPTDLHIVGSVGTVARLTGKTCTAKQIVSDDLNGIWGSGATNIIAVGDQGTMLRFEGKSWASDTSFSGSVANLWAVWGTGPLDVHVAGDGVLHHFDGKWTKTSPTKQSVHGLHGAGGVHHAVGGLGTMLLRKGAAWILTSTLSTNGEAAIRAIRGNSVTDIMATGDDGTALRFAGKTWGDTSSAATGYVLDGAWAAGGGAYWTTGHLAKDPWTPVILHYSGTAWTSATFKTTSLMLHDIWGYKNRLFAVGGTANSNKVKILEKNGTGPWTVVEHSAKSRGVGVWGRSDTDVYMVGRGVASTVLHRDGTSWKEVTPNPSCALYNDVWGTGPSTVFLAGRHKNGYGCVQRLTGTTLSKTWLFEKTLLGEYYLAYAVWGSGPSNVYVAGAASNGKASLLRYDGMLWKVVEIGTGIDFTDIWGTSATNIYLVGAGGAILHRK